MTSRDGLDNPRSDPADDKFDRWPFSKRLADTIAVFDTRNGAPVFGIFGRWGYGKSTVLNYIKREFETTHADKVILFEFNPWLFTNQEELIAHFFAGLAAKLDESLSNRGADAGQFLQRFSGVFAIIPAVGGGVSKLAEQFGKELSDNPLNAQRERVFEIMRSARRTVVVLIDDLDRLDQAEILTMLKLIRLNANFPHIVYVLAFDDQMVAKAVGTQYGGGLEVGRQFLEKIVQYAYSLPAVGHERLVSFVLTQARESCRAADVQINEKEWKQLRELMDLYFSQRLNTPRQAIRYANALDFALPMLNTEANPYEQMLVEGLRVLFPELYVLLRDNTRSITKATIALSARMLDDTSLDEYIQSAMKNSSQDEIIAGTTIIRELFANPDRSQSIAWKWYFDRYFTYAAPKLPISEIEVYKAIENKSDYVELSESFANQGRADASTLLDAIFAFPHKQALAGGRGLVVVKALARIGELFLSDPNRVLWGALSREETYRYNPLLIRVQNLIVRILQYVNNERSKTIVDIIDIVRAASPLDFAVRLSLSLPRILDVGSRELDSLRSELIREFATQEPSNMLRHHALEDTGSYFDLLDRWRSYGNIVQREWLQDLLRTRPRTVVPLMRHIKELTFGGEKFGVVKWVSPVSMREALDNHFGPLLSESAPIDEQTLPFDKQDILLAREFKAQLNQP